MSLDQRPGLMNSKRCLVYADEMRVIDLYTYSHDQAHTPVQFRIEPQDTYALCIGTPLHIAVGYGMRCL